MNEKKDTISENKIRLILFCILGLNIILMIFLIFQNSNILFTGNKYEIISITSKESSQDVFGFENAKVLLGVSLKSDNISTGEILKKIEIFATKALPFINKYLSDENSSNLETVYKDNIELLLNYSGIEKEEELTKMCNKLKNVECNLNEISKASFVSDSLENDNNILKINIKLIDKNQKYITIKLVCNPENDVKYKFEIL